GPRSGTELLTQYSVLSTQYSLRLRRFRLIRLLVRGRGALRRFATLTRDDDRHFRDEPTDEADRHPVRPDGADRVIEGNLAPVDLLADRAGEFVRDLLRRDRTEEPTALAHPRREGERRRGDLVTERAELLFLLADAPVRRRLPLLHLLDRAGRGDRR